MKSFRTILAAMISLVALILALPMIFLLSIFKLASFWVKTMGHLIEPRSVPWQAVIEFDSHLGWKPKSGLDVQCLAHFDDLFQLHTDQEGWSGFTSLEASDVVVLGDSFAFGYGMDTRSCFFEINPNLKVKPLGAPGYSMVQPLILLDQLRHQLRSKLVVWCIFLENDLYDNLMSNFLHYKAPFIRDKNGTNQWELVTEHIDPTRWHNTGRLRGYLTILAKLCRPGKFSRRVYSGCEFILKTGQDLCHQAGAELVVLTAPSVQQLAKVGLASLSSRLEGEPIDPDFPDQRISEICDSHGIHFVAGKKLLDARDYKRAEQIHWNKRGHKKISDLIANLYQAYALGTLDQFVRNESYKRHTLKILLEKPERDKARELEPTG